MGTATPQHKEPMNLAMPSFDAFSGTRVNRIPGGKEAWWKYDFEVYRLGKWIYVVSFDQRTDRSLQQAKKEAENRGEIWRLVDANTCEILETMQMN